MLEAALRLLFSTADLSLVKSYCCRQWAKILGNRVSVQVGAWEVGRGLQVGADETETRLENSTLIQSTQPTQPLRIHIMLEFRKKKPKDFIFCKEVRLGTYSANAATLPPAAVVAARAMAADPRAEPR